MAMSQSLRMPSPEIFKVYFETLSLSERCFRDCSNQGVERVGGYRVLSGWESVYLPLTSAALILCIL